MTGSVLIDASALTAIHRHARRRRLLETGGALFGYESYDVVDTVAVVFAAGPGPRALHRPTGLVADSSHTQRLIDFVANHTGGICRYIGSWHTHSAGRAAPSGRDTDTARAISAQLEVQLPRPLLMIAATWPGPAGQRIRDITAWRLDDRGHALRRHAIDTASCNRWSDLLLT